MIDKPINVPGQYISGDGIWVPISKEGDQQAKEKILGDLAQEIIGDYKKENPVYDVSIPYKGGGVRLGSSFTWAQGGKRSGIILTVANVLANYYPNRIETIYYNSYPTINGYDTEDGDLAPSIKIKTHRINGVGSYQTIDLILDCAVRHPNTPDKTCLELSLKGEKGCSRELNNRYGAVMQIKDGVITYKGKGVTTTHDLGGVERKQ